MVVMQVAGKFVVVGGAEDSILFLWRKSVMGGGSGSKS